MAEIQGIDPETVTPEEFAGLVTNADDSQIADVVHAVGTERVLDRIFEGMEERFLPDRAGSTEAAIQFVITDEGAEYPYGVVIANGSCRVTREQLQDPRVSLTTDVISFSKLVAGKVQGPQLFMSGKLKVAGDLMFSAQIMNFFDSPKVS